MGTEWQVGIIKNANNQDPDNGSSTVILRQKGIQGCYSAPHQWKCSAFPPPLTFQYHLQINTFLSVSLQFLVLEGHGI